MMATERITGPVAGRELEIIAELEAANKDLIDVLLRNGFARCDIAACNCGSWHHRYGLPERFQEFKETLADAGHPLTNENGNLAGNALSELVRERDELQLALASSVERIAELERENADLRNSIENKIMSMSDDQINAAIQLEGRDPDDVGKISKHAVEMALVKSENKNLRARIEECILVIKNECNWTPEKGWPLYGQEIVGLKQEIADLRVALAASVGRCAGICTLKAQVEIGLSNDCLAANQYDASLTRARQAQTATECSDAILALAPADALEAVRKLREDAERGVWILHNVGLLHTWATEWLPDKHGQLIQYLTKRIDTEREGYDNRSTPYRQSSTHC